MKKHLNLSPRLAQVLESSPTLATEWLKRHAGLLLGVALVVALFSACADPAWAGPGGIVKAASKSLVGKILMGVLAVILLPLIIWYQVRWGIAVKKTRRDLAALAQKHPQYHWLTINDRVTAVYSWVWSAWGQSKMENAKAFCTPWYWQNQQLQLDEWSRHGLTNVCRLVKITRVTPLFVQHIEENGGLGSRLIVDVRARVIDYLEDSTGRLVQGDKQEGDSDTVWSLVWQDTGFGGAWMLNKIEEGGVEFDYLFAPNEIPQQAPQPAKA
jgi:hypothetical protein